MGRILFRYIAREVVTPFTLGVFIFTFVVFMFQILKIADWVVNYGVGLIEIGRIFGYLLFPLFTFTIPMAFLLAVMLAVNRLSGDSEMTAMKAAGISLYQMLPPLVALALITMAATFALTYHLEPWGKQQIKRLLVDLGKKKATLAITEQVFVTEFSGLVIYVNEIKPGTDELTGVFISDETDPQRPRIAIAPAGRLFYDSEKGRMIVRLEQGSIHLVDDKAGAYDKVGFETFDYSLDLSAALSGEGLKTEYHELTTRELAAYIKKLKETEGDTFDMRRAWVEYHRRFAFPFACLIFGVVGLPLGISPPRSGKSRGFSIAIVVLCAYYLFFRVGENIGWKGVAHPAVVMWLPNVVFAALGAILIHKKANESPIRSIDFLAFQWERVTLWISRRFFGDKPRNEGGNG